MKRMAWSLLFWLMGVAAWAQSPAPSPGEAKALVLHRPYSRGQTYEIALRLEGQSKGTMGIGESTSGQSQNFRLDLSGTVKVVSVNGLGEPTLLVLSVAKGHLLLDGEEKVLDLDGAELGISFPNGKVRFTRKDGKPLAKEAEGLLSQSFVPPKGVHPDEVLGPGRPVKPGESWTLKPELLARLLASGAEGNLAPGPSNFEGTMTYLGPETWNGIPCSHVRASMVMKDLKIPKFVGTIRTDITEDLWLPEDASSIRFHRAITLVNDMWGKFLSGDGKALDVRSKDTLTLDLEAR